MPQHPRFRQTKWVQEARLKVGAKAEEEGDEGGWDSAEEQM